MAEQEAEEAPAPVVFKKPVRRGNVRKREREVEDEGAADPGQTR